MSPSERLNWIAGAWLGIGLLTTSPAWADATYQVRPPTITLDPIGSGASSSFEIVSTGDEPVAVEIHAVERQMDVNGAETQADAADYFIIYPPQILLQPGEAQTVRVSWLGNPTPESELAYRIITEQLPIQMAPELLEGASPNIAITALYRFISSVYITPQDAASHIVLESASHQTQNGQDQLVLLFHNQGTAHQLLTSLDLTLTAGGQRVQLAPEQLEGVSGENILAQHQRRFAIPWPSGLPVGPISAEFTIQTDEQ